MTLTDAVYDAIVQVLVDEAAGLRAEYAKRAYFAPAGVPEREGSAEAGR